MPRDHKILYVFDAFFALDTVVAAMSLPPILFSPRGALRPSDNRTYCQIRTINPQKNFVAKIFLGGFQPQYRFVCNLVSLGLPLK